MVTADKDVTIADSKFLQQFETPVVIRRTFIHLITSSIEPQNADDATKRRKKEKNRFLFTHIDMHNQAVKTYTECVCTPLECTR
jgi:hypothetical protein